MIYKAIHGTTDDTTNFDYINDSCYVAYFSDSLSLAKHFALKPDEGGILEGEKPTLIFADIELNNPLIVNENDWEDYGDICNIDKDNLIKRGHDGIMCLNSSNCTYYVVFNTNQIKNIVRQFL